jgi:hypothetical protein
MIRKPVQSERLRSGVRTVSGAARVPSVARPRSGRTPSVMAPPPAGVDEGLQQREQGVEAGPVRVYSSGSNKRPRSLNGTGASPRRRRHLKIAVITGLIGFLIAAAVLTLPELLFGGSVTGGGRSTTYFGGGSSNTSKSQSQDGGKSGQTTPQNPDSTTPGNTTQPDQGGAQPSTTTPQTSPSPQNTTPAPAPSPAPQTPAPTPPAP